MKYLNVVSILLTASVVARGSTPLPHERIVNGQLATSGQFPYQVGLSMVFGNLTGWCGGSLISDRWIVSAAHCLDGADGVTVYLGAIDILDVNEPGQQRLYCSRKYITIHEGYRALTYTHDIALVKLPVFIDFTATIQPVALPKKSSTYETYVGEVGVASGWGHISDANADVSQFLRFMEVPVLEKRKCNTYFLGLVTDNMICVSAENGQSICSGDSGGPLVHREGVDYVLIGVTSFGIIFGCESGWPGVFTRITSYVDWIEEKTGVVNV